MFAALAARLVPIRDYLYLALAIAAVTAFLVYRHSLIEKGVNSEKAAVTAASVKLQAAAEAKYAALQASYSSALTTIKDDHAKQAAADAATHLSDIARLRAYDDYRRTHQAVDGASAGPGTAVAGSGSAPEDGDSFTKLGVVSSVLADALRGSDNALNSCMAERDELVGK